MLPYQEKYIDNLKQILKFAETIRTPGEDFEVCCEMKSVRKSYRVSKTSATSSWTGKTTSMSASTSSFMNPF